MMDPLGALVILFVVMSVVSVIGILLMYLTKEEKVKKGIFYFLIAWINVKGIPPMWKAGKLSA